MVTQADRGVVPGMSFCRPSFLDTIWQREGIIDLFLLHCFSHLAQAVSMDDNGPSIIGNVSFANPLVNDILEAQDQNNLEDALVRNLFGGIQASQIISAWNPLVLQSIQAKCRNGLNEEIRIGSHQI